MVRPEFAGMSPTDLEFRADGTLARKDRWEQGIRQIAGIVGMDPRQTFEVHDIVGAVRMLTKAVQDAGLTVLPVEPT